MSFTIAQPAISALPTPRSLEVLMEFLRAEVECARCGAEPGRPCKWQRRPGVHLGRFIRAFASHQITAKELERLAGILPRNGAFGMCTIIRDDSQPQLYVVVNVEPGGHRVGVTDPMSAGHAEQFADREAPYFAGRLEVVPARPEDLADTDADR